MGLSHNVTLCLDDTMVATKSYLLESVIDYYAKKSIVANLHAEKPPKEVTSEVQKMSSDYSEPIIGDDVELDDDVSQGSTKRIRKLTSKRVRNGFVDLFYEYKSDSSDSMSSIALVSENSSSSGSQWLVGSSKQESLAAFHAWFDNELNKVVAIKVIDLEES
ncbi:Adenylate kinase 4 [Camellia lanceoleosa]|uniref:Adenylate kinase 4 n=1 Tax=Camellia lanceoleosa TaxID=1840588 RepID=A0ACC0FBQ6_9ERIC|nr:Adenylate kinase 4 [Camellia lanceoleosa]